MKYSTEKYDACSVQCCGSGRILFIWAEPDPGGSKKSWEIHIKIYQNYKNIIFLFEKSPFVLIHMNNQLINNNKNQTFEYYIIFLIINYIFFAAGFYEADSDKRSGSRQKKKRINNTGSIHLSSTNPRNRSF